MKNSVILHHLHRWSTWSTVPGAISCLPSRQSDCFVTMNLGGGDRMDGMKKKMDVAG